MACIEWIKEPDYRENKKGESKSDRYDRSILQRRKLRLRVVE